MISLCIIVWYASASSEQVGDYTQRTRTVVATTMVLPCDVYLARTVWVLFSVVWRYIASYRTVIHGATMLKGGGHGVLVITGGAAAIQGWRSTEMSWRCCGGNEGCQCGDGDASAWRRLMRRQWRAPMRQWWRWDGGGRCVCVEEAMGVVVMEACNGVYPGRWAWRCFEAGSQGAMQFIYFESWDANHQGGERGMGGCMDYPNNNCL